MWDVVLMAVLLVLVAAPTPAPRARGGSRGIILTHRSGLQFTFSIECCGGHLWRAFIVQQPMYPAGTPTDGHSTHRNAHRPSGRYFVCWEPEPQTEEQALEAARRWVLYTVQLFAKRSES